MIEIVIVIVTLSIASAGILKVFDAALGPQNAPHPLVITHASYLVQEGMEKIRADRKNKGFNHINSQNYPDEILDGGQIRSYSFGTCTVDPDLNHCREVAVRISQNGQILASAVTWVAHYDQ